jgi:hypothetical protein
MIKNALKIHFWNYDICVKTIKGVKMLISKLTYKCMRHENMKPIDIKYIYIYIYINTFENINVILKLENRLNIAQFNLVESL